MERIKRRAPKRGYDNDAKQEYRENVWDHLSPKVKPLLKEDINAKVLLMPSKEGIEIDVAISKGIKPEQIIAIDENGALIAHSEWRKKHPKVKYFGSKVSVVGDKIKNKGWYLVGANLDFCSNLGGELISEINGFFQKTPIHNSFSFFVTMAKGRESGGTFLLLNKMGRKEIFQTQRMNVLYKVAKLPILTDYYWACDFESEYRSSKMTMIYACLSSVRGRIYNEEMLDIDKRIKILLNRLHYMSNCKVGRNGAYRQKSDQVCRINDSIYKEMEGLTSRRTSIIRLQADLLQVIERDVFINDHEPSYFIHCAYHLNSNYSFLKTHSAYNKEYWCDIDL